MRSLGRKLLAIAALLVAAALAAPPASAKLADKDWKKAQADFEQAFASSDTQAMCAAVKALAADGTKRAVDLLIGVGASDKLEDIAVYDAIREALAVVDDPEAVKYMLDQVSKSQAWTLRCVLVDALAGRSGADVTSAIAARLDDKVPYVISAAAKALGKRKDKVGVDPLVKKLGELEKKPKDVIWIDVRQALVDITGEDFASAKEWEGYWLAKKDTFDPEKDRGQKTDAGMTTERDGIKFFTEPIISKRIMFVIDVSGSMNEKDIPVEGKGMMRRIDVVKNELAATVQQLKPDVRFNIISFSHILKAWQPSKAGLQPANGENKANALTWISNLKADGATNTDDALKEAFANIDVNTIVLLSDGIPEHLDVKTQQPDPSMNGDKICGLTRAWNRLRHVQIHTFGFKIFEKMGGGGRGGGGGGNPLDFLEKLATENGGKLHKV